MQIPVWQRLTIAILDFLILNWGSHANPNRPTEPLHGSQIYWGAIGLLGIPVGFILAALRWDVAWAVYGCAPIIVWIAYMYVNRIPATGWLRFALWCVVTFFVVRAAMWTGPYISTVVAGKNATQSATIPPQPPTPAKTIPEVVVGKNVVQSSTTPAQPPPGDIDKPIADPKPPISKPGYEPEVVLAPSVANLVLTWVPGVDMTPRISVAGKSGYPAMELRGLSAQPIVGITINWRVASNVSQLPKARHLSDFGARISDGMLWLKNGPGLSVGQTAKTEVSFLGSDPVVVDLPPQIWNAFVLALISDRERPDRPSATNSGFLRTTATVGDAVITYRQGGASFTRAFRLEASVVTQHDSTIVGGSHIQQVPLDRYSAHNLRANLRLSISPVDDDQNRPAPAQTQSLYEMFVSDFANTVRLKDKVTIATGSEKVDVTFQVYYDFGARSRFVGFYLPDSTQTQKLSISLAEDIPGVLDAFASNKVISGGLVGQPLQDKDLVFTNLVYLYHLTDLPIEARAAIKEAFSAKRLEVQFRGPEYFLMRNQGR